MGALLDRLPIFELSLVGQDVLSALSTFAGDDLCSYVGKILHVLILLLLGHTWSYYTPHWKTLAKVDKYWIEGSIDNIQKDIVCLNVV